MGIALALVAAGLLTAPAWDRIVGGGITVPYLVGLALIGAGELLLMRRIVLGAREARRGGGRGMAGVRAALAMAAVVGLFLAAEVAASAWIVASGSRMDLFEFRSRQRFTSMSLKSPHPFLILTNNPEAEGINSLGFLDAERKPEKEPGVTRIACIGGSTTEDGYPARLESLLNARLAPARFEVINFGNAGWTTAQSLINYELTVRHFKPDLVIIHEGVNDMKVRGYGEFRTDFSHAFNPLTTPPPRPDAALLRYSNAYALAKFHYYRSRGINPGMDVYAAITRESRRPVGVNDAEMQVTLGNIAEIAALARMHGARVILTTMPHSRTNASWGGHYFDHMAKLNEGVKRIAAETGAPCVDLDAVIGGNEANFIDPVHLANDAVMTKAVALADRLAEILAAPAPAGSPAGN